MMSDDREAIARLSRVYRAGAAVRVGSLTYTSQCFPALSVAGIRQFSPVSTCQGEGRGFESRRPLQKVFTFGLISSSHMGVRSCGVMLGVTCWASCWTARFRSRHRGVWRPWSSLRRARD